jgi:hypothetical protein
MLKLYLLTGVLLVSCWCPAVALLLVLLQLLDELYHEDKGFNRQQSVFLCHQPPSLDVQHVMLTHHAARKVTYLQGSPFRMEVCMCAFYLLIALHPATQSCIC